MSEPDFEHLALCLMDHGDDHQGMLRIAEQLRQVWMARGAADLVKPITELITKYETCAARCEANMRDVKSGNINRYVEGMRDAFNDVVSDLDTLVDR